MSDTHETSTDIIAEYRDDADKMDAHELPQPTTQYLRIMLARLEAAHKRELSKICPKTGGDFGQLGDAAKLREAAKKAQIFIRSCGVESVSPLPGCGLSASDVISEIDAALSAPRRNCDRPECATTKAAQDVWRKEDGGKTAYYEWLLAPATEKEGGKDED